ncbi:MAG TPA: hypothetical protein VIL69_17295 [Roseomonas sp.]|jgi:hypothetical protein
MPNPYSERPDHSFWSRAVAVYPEIGRRLGLPGHYLFRILIRGEEPIQVMDLPAFVARSFDMYRAMPERVAEAVERHPRARPLAENLAAMLRRA